MIFNGTQKLYKYAHDIHWYLGSGKDANITMQNLNIIDRNQLISLENIKLIRSQYNSPETYLRENGIDVFNYLSGIPHYDNQVEIIPPECLSIKEVFSARQNAPQDILTTIINKNTITAAKNLFNQRYYRELFTKDERPITNKGERDRRFKTKEPKSKGVGVDSQQGGKDALVVIGLLAVYFGSLHFSEYKKKKNCEMLLIHPLKDVFVERWNEHIIRINKDIKDLVAGDNNDALMTEPVGDQIKAESLYSDAMIRMQYHQAMSSREFDAIFQVFKYYIQKDSFKICLDYLDTVKFRLFSENKKLNKLLK
jgi:hypothetical protein